MYETLISFWNPILLHLTSSVARFSRKLYLIGGALL